MVFVTLILRLHGAALAARRHDDGPPAPLADAVFTAVSTICVTGLSTVDIATFFSPFGKVVIFLGVNIGGMGVLTLASILGLVISKRLGLRAKLIAASDTNPLRAHGGPVNEGQTVRLGEVGQLLRTVALSTLLIEALVAIALFPSLILAGIHPLDALWEAPFYAAMAFTNTGLHAEPRRPRAVRRRLLPPDGADGRRVPRQHRLPGDLHALEARRGTCAAGRCTPS